MRIGSVILLTTFFSVGWSIQVVGDTPIWVFNREVSLPGRCLFYPSSKDEEVRGYWACGTKPGEDGANVIIADRALIESEKIWNNPLRQNITTKLSGDLEITTFQIDAEDRIALFGYVCSLENCIKVVSFQKYDFMKIFIGQFE